jgi:diguanylate cyclase (GGDEF)-like protein
MNELRSALVLSEARINDWQAMPRPSQATGICALLINNQALSQQAILLHRGSYEAPGHHSLTSSRFHFEHLSQERPQGQGKITSANQEVFRVRQLLAISLDSLDVGLEIWDEQDRLVLYNKKINQLLNGLHTPASIGQTYSQLMRVSLAQHLIKTEIGCEEEWLSLRLLSRGNSKEPVLHEFSGDRWANTYETRTPEGYLIVAWVDVTELVRKGRVLEAINQQLSLLSSIDALTGLANRRRLDEALQIESQPGCANGAPLSLLMVDIDHFKNYNDHYGHLAGDACLRRVAEVLGQCVRRSGELVARYGGEEFVMLLPGADLAQACETAQKCLDLMQAEAISHAASPLCERVTLSIGVACLHPDSSLNPAHILNAADAAMYRAKTDGRARYKIADQSDWESDKSTQHCP